MKFNVKLVVVFSIPFLFAEYVKAENEEWTLTPLGAPGTLSVPKEFPKKPHLSDQPPQRPDGLVLFDTDCTASVVVRSSVKKVRLLAEEIRWHLAEMTGHEVLLLDAPPSNGAPFIEVGTDDVPSQTAILKIEGNKVTVSGDGSGVSHAATYLLESLGIRYLWPGKSGKVIPKKTRVVLQKISLNDPPQFKIRDLRIPVPEQIRSKETALPFLGIDIPTFTKRYREAQVDRAGNRTFYQWHGFNDFGVIDSNKPSLQRTITGGHYFGDYYAKFKESHPEWFALQPWGTRENKYKRPRLCLSNEKLIHEIIRDRVAEMKAHPTAYAVSICLPDGDRDAPCMCPKCRKLDPINAPVIDFSYYNPERTTKKYVSLSDRMLWFSNRIAEEFVQECPDKKLKVFAYADYVNPPVRLRPHPALIIFNVEGELNNPETIGREVASVAGWNSFGNEIIWRPNILMALKAPVPQNFARQLYEEMQLFRENGIIGVCFDCFNGEFINHAFTFYMLGRGLFNRDRLTYEGQVQDWCACFGKASGTMREYLDLIESAFTQTLAKHGGATELIESYPIEKLDKLFARAATEATGDTDSLERIAFLRKGVTAAREFAKLNAVWRSGDWHALFRARDDYKDYVRQTAMENPATFNPIELGMSCPYLRGRPFKK
ncbi:MAG: DUF4838 domain-containing protein [Kiritimatiellae bacterium]|nr:DUF4838 domain-containing protein [Kiritimatiellia bacterium]